MPFEFLPSHTFGGRQTQPTPARKRAITAPRHRRQPPALLAGIIGITGSWAPDRQTDLPRIFIFEDWHEYGPSRPADTSVIFVVFRRLVHISPIRRDSEECLYRWRRSPSLQMPLQEADGGAVGFQPSLV